MKNALCSDILFIPVMCTGVLASPTSCHVSWAAWRSLQVGMGDEVTTYES